MFIQDFRSSIASYSKGLKLINELKLWKYFLVPILITALVGILFIWLAISLSDNIGEYMASWWPFTFLESAIETMAEIMGGFLIIIIGLLVYKHLVMALAAPFMTPVSEKIEMHLTGKELNPTDTPAEYIAALVRGLKINARNLILELLITLPLLILGLIPVINIFTTILIFYVQAYYAGFGNMDYTMERHFDYSGSIKFVRKHKGIAAGNGLVYMLLLMIPVVGICLALPLSTASSTIDTVEKLNEK